MPLLPPYNGYPSHDVIHTGTGVNSGLETDNNNGDVVRTEEYI